MSLSHYVKAFSNLHTAVGDNWTAETKRRAPNKPLLLLSVIDLFAEGIITTNLIEISPDLLETFTVYWSRVMPPDRRGNIALPFFYLKSEGFWHLIAKPGKQDILGDEEHQVDQRASRDRCRRSPRRR